MHEPTAGTMFGEAFLALRRLAELAVCGLLLTGCVTDMLSSDKNAETVAEPGAVEEAPPGAAVDPGASQAVDEHLHEEVALSRELVTYVQGRLAALGYEPGPIDGLIGPKTRGSVQRYQENAGLPANGKITEAVLAGLEGRSESGSGAEPSARVESGPAPAYDAGTQFVYADGEIHTVLGVEGAQVRWHSNRSGGFVAYNNFLLPPLAWHSPEESGMRLADSSPDELWPLETGQELTFRTTSMIQHGQRPDNSGVRHETWRCRIEGSETLKLRAGTFDTRKIVCDGRSEPGGPDLRRVWHYVPEIRHFVLYQESGGMSSWRSVELLAIQPNSADWPPVARAGLGWAFEHALETAADGEETTWSSSAVDTRVTIKSGPRVAAGRRQTCRSFVQVWSEPEGERIYPGFACRSGSGQWAIPGLDSGITVAAN
ncbi:MAG: peptidoglycan-binding protein [Kiloniellales bacterium]